MTSPGKPSQPKRRVFFALWPKPAVAEKLFRWPPTDTPGRRIDPSKLHLTLAFIGEVDDDQLKRLLDIGSRLTWQPFPLTLDRLGYWPHNRIVWAGAAEEPALARLVADLNTALKAASFSTENRFRAHITLMRNAERPAKSVRPDPLVWPVEAVTLAASTFAGGKAIYQPLAHWK